MTVSEEEAVGVDKTRLNRGVFPVFRIKKHRKAAKMGLSELLNAKSGGKYQVKIVRVKGNVRQRTSPRGWRSKRQRIGDSMSGNRNPSRHDGVI